MENKIFDIAVIGGGASGTMATLRSVLNNDKTLFFSGSIKEKRLSRDAWLDKVEKIPGLSRYNADRRAPYGETLEFIKTSAFKDQLLHIENMSVKKIDKNEDGVFSIYTDEHDVYFANYLIVCTGVEYKLPIINEQSIDFLIYQNVVASDLGDYVESYPLHERNVSVLAACERAIYSAIVIKERINPQSLIIFTNGKSLKNDLKIDDETLNLLKLYKIKIQENKITDYETDGALLNKLIFSDNSSYNVDFLYLLLGYEIHNDLLQSLPVKYDEKGYVIANEKGETDVENLYVSGDILKGVKKQIFTAYDHSVNSADDINAKIRVKKRNIKLK